MLGAPTVATASAFSRRQHRYGSPAARGIIRAMKIRTILLRWVLPLIVVGAVVMLALWYMPGYLRRTVEVGVGKEDFAVWIAKTPEQLTKGLGGVRHLPARGGMLFDFGRDDTWRIWMKDMRIPIDVLWLDREGRVIHMVRDMQPASYPKHHFPYKKARYVLELPAGAAARAGVEQGSSIRLPQEL